jgi:ferric-dicitrate binding protein FerR (iron transport regulator)
MSSNSLFRLKFLFNKYLTNTCTAEEFEELFLLINTEENSRQVETILQSLWEDTGPVNTQDQSGDDSKQLFARLLKMIEDKPDYQRHFQKPNHLRRWAVAASLLMLLGAGWYTLKKRAPQNAPQLASNAVVKKRNTTILLPDGSKVVLNKDSHLNYPTKFNGKNREVYLTGEGYFDIAHDAAHPFLVHARNLTTRVLGTAFNIKAYPGDKLVEVTVTRGKVLVSDDKKSLAILLPNQYISYNENNSIYKKDITNSKLAVLWKEDDLVMDNISIKDAAAILSERYGVKLIMANTKIQNCRFTASFLNTTGLDQMLNVLCRLNNIKFITSDDGKEITLLGEGCN